MAAKPPFDPIHGAWVLLMALVLTVAANSGFLFVGCAIFRVAEMCQRTGNNLKDITLELITAIAVLVSVRR
jgi:hypothetical protein